MGQEAETKSFLLAAELRKQGAKVEIDHMGRSVKAQIKYADKVGARYVLVLGGDELEKGEAKLKRMSDGTETTTAINAEQILKFII
jgi:histidyl-tRNA synthetase